MSQAAQPPQPAKPWYTIQARTPVASAVQGVKASAEILIYGDIGDSWWGESVTAAQFVKDINALQADQITVRINSYGGSVHDGVAIHNAMKRHPASIDVQIDGLAASIASLIAMAGDRVTIAENALLMIHAPLTGVWGNAAQMRETADMLDTHSRAVATSYASKSGKSAADVLALLTDGKDHWFTAAEALAEGYVDAVNAASDDGAQATARFDLSRFKDVPAALLRARPTAAAAAAVTPVASATSPQEHPMTQQVNQPAATPNPAATHQPQPAAPLAPAAAPVVDVASVLAADKARRESIRAMGQPFMAHEGMAAFMAGLENDHTVTADIAGQRILAQLGRGAEPVAGGRIVTVADEADKRREAMVNAMLMRAGKADAKVVAESGANPYRGRTLLAIAEASLQAAGVDTRQFGDKRAMVAAAFTQSSSDFPVLLENVMHKTLLGAYALQALTWSRFCKRGSVSDFRAHNRYRVGSLGNLQPKNELGEYKNVAIPDGEKSSIAAATKGFILNISRETVINDDLGALTDQAAAAGRAAARTVEVDVYALLTSNSGLGPVMNDGKTLYHADHGNIDATGGAISVTRLDAMRVLMAQQRDITGNDFLDLRPAVLLCPIGAGGNARVVIGAEYDTDVSNKFQVPNRVRGLVRDIVDTPRLSGTRYHLLADASDSAAIEVVFLDGVDTPYLETVQAFDTDGGRLKVRLDYGVGGHDWRGAVTNAGA
ncbi:MAG: Clp protease ClpP [Hydrogenophaga sp.]|jgi:ATP-dependent protease ClpP protease subunit|nr:Clp protease ClpP [Hydrogenophaga sp.]